MFPYGVPSSVVTPIILHRSLGKKHTTRLAMLQVFAGTVASLSFSIAARL